MRLKQEGRDLIKSKETFLVSESDSLLKNKTFLQLAEEGKVSVNMKTHYRTAFIYALVTKRHNPQTKQYSLHCNIQTFDSETEFAQSNSKTRFSGYDEHFLIHKPVNEFDVENENEFFEEKKPETPAKPETVKVSKTKTSSKAKTQQPEKKIVPDENEIFDGYKS